MKKLKTLLTVVIILIIIGVVLVSAGSAAVTDYLWFRNLGFLQTFMVLFFSDFIIR